MQKVSAIVCAYNEAKNIKAVLAVLADYSQFSEVIVVDDGSADATARIARQFSVRLVRLRRNQGKGAAMDAGVQASSGDIIFFCDADVKGLTGAVIEETLAQVLAGKQEMMIAMRNRKIYFLRSIMRFIPLLGGERAVSRQLWNIVPMQYKQGFMIEAALNFYAKHYGRGYGFKVFSGLSQTIKEKKYGLWIGLRARIRMFIEIIYAQVTLHRHNRPRSLRLKTSFPK
jgi:polyprenyl-phospho-N-acetylgalactosaminyl synthase